MLSPVRVSPRFAAVTLEVGKPLPYVTYERTRHDGEKELHKVHQKQLKREMEAVATIVTTWLSERKADLDKFTANRNIKLKLMTEEDFNFQYTNKDQRKRERAINQEHGGQGAWAARIGLKAFDVDAQGQETRLQVRWPGNNPDGPFYPKDFQGWAEDFIIKPRNLFNALSKALKQGVANIGVKNSLTFESES